MEVESQVDFVVPLEIAVMIFEKLAPKTLLVAKQVCKAWYWLLSIDDFVWPLICRARWPLAACRLSSYNGSWQRMACHDNLKNKVLSWAWDTQYCGQGIHLLENNRVAYLQNPIACQVLCSLPCALEERFYFEVKIVHSTRGAINIGLATRKSNLNGRCGTDSQGWSYSLFSGSLFHASEWSSVCSGTASTGCYVGMGIDMKRLTVSFFCNDQLQAVAKLDPSAVKGLDLYPSVSLGDIADCVMIVSRPDRIPQF